MNSVPSKTLTTNLSYALFLLVLVTVYAFHLFPFTVFEGFATLSNDSFSYILLARKWSPYFDPTMAELMTWPVHTYPPGFAWLLAITGASESTYLGHVAVSTAMLLSIVLMGWFAYQKVGWALGGLMAIAFCLLPGAVVHSMGILSENIYLSASLGALVVYSHLRQHPNPGLGWPIALFLCTCLALLTRTVGIALVAALLIVPLLDKKLARDMKIAVVLVALASLAAWFVWLQFDPQSAESRYLSFLKPALGTADMTLGERLQYFMGFVRVNAIEMLLAWNHYLSLTHSNAYFFWFSFALAAICLASAGLRAWRFQLDAVYLIFYLAIVLMWPYPAEMVRFLHPAVMLLLVQPVLSIPTLAPMLHQSSTATAQEHALTGFRSVGVLDIVSTMPAHSSVAKASHDALLNRLATSTGATCGLGGSPRQVAGEIVIVAVVFALGINSLIIQNKLVSLRREARAENPAVVHALEYYNVPGKEDAVHKSLIFQDVILLMEKSTEVVPPGSTVASTTPMAYTLLADRASVNLSAVVPYHQQLCNFQIREVDYVFLSTITNSYNELGLDLAEHYQDISAYTWSLENRSGEPGIYILKLDHERIEGALNEAGFECTEFRDRPVS